VVATVYVTRQEGERKEKKKVFEGTCDVAGILFKKVQWTQNRKTMLTIPTTSLPFHVIQE
jgi:hypothetical protein